MASIGLCMIVKDEAKVIERCLDSVRPLIDYVLVEDTGSTDGTQDIVRRWLEKEGIPGRVVEEPWRDFAYNRSHSLAELRNEPDVDYALIMDADDHAVIDPGFDAAKFRQSLDLDAYTVELRQNTISYRRTQICSNRKRFFYKGVLHEYLECLDQPVTTGGAEGFYVISAREGARSQDPQKYAKDAALLERALQEETDEFLISRYTFYLAQSYRDAGRDELALANYLKRAELGYWPAERFYSLYQAGKIMDRLGWPVQEVLGTYERAWAMHPTRAESLHAAAALCRRLGRHSEGLGYAQRGLAIGMPENCLFVEHWVYKYGIVDEIGVSAYWTGDYALSIAACERLLREEIIPAEQRQRIEDNHAFGTAKLGEIGVSPAEQRLMLARAAEKVRDDPSVVLDAYNAAAEESVEPAGVLSEAARYCRVQGLFQQGYEYARRGLLMLAALPDADKNTRRSLLDEFAVNAYWIGQYEESSEASDALLAHPELPQADRDRIRKNKEFADGKRKSHVKISRAGAEEHWTPASPMGGTEIMLEGLRKHVGPALEAINLCLNAPEITADDERPNIVWIHHNADQDWVEWCGNPEWTSQVDAFVFVSYWQMERFVSVFGLPREKCAVLRNAIEPAEATRKWQRPKVWRCAYASTPFRGLSLLLDAWELVSPDNAELHIWSSMRIYGLDDSEYEPLYDRARSMPSVHYHGIVPNDELRTSLQDINYLTYPSTFEETSCLSVIEAMDAGARVIVPELGALPETTAGYARLYPWSSDEEQHVRTFADVLSDELRQPWNGRTDLAWRQQAYCRDMYSWRVRSAEWKQAIRKWTAARQQTSRIRERS